MSVWKAYNCYFWPTIVVISPDGKVLKKWEEDVPEKELDAFLMACEVFYDEKIDKTRIEQVLEESKQSESKS